MSVSRTAIAIRVKGTNTWLGCDFDEAGRPLGKSRLIENATDEQKDKFGSMDDAELWVANIIEPLRNEGKELEFVEIEYTTPS